MRSNPFIACLCATYKRPTCLANAVACFLAQEYENKVLVIVDDAAQYNPREYDWKQPKNILMISWQQRGPSLSEKRNEVARIAKDGYEPEIFAVWDDDDVYLPNHLSNIAAGYERGGEFFLHKKVLTTYDCGETGKTVLEQAVYEVAGPWETRFHSSWAFTRELFERVGGYPPPMPNGQYDDFETQLGINLKRVGKVEYIDGDGPSYVCRVFNQAEYHLTQTDGKSYQDNWERIGKLPSPFVGELFPKMDDWTKRLYVNLTGVKA